MSILESSTNYREITLAEARDFAASEHNNGWLDASMPQRQYDTVVKRELEAYRGGASNPPYDVLVSLLKQHPLPPNSTLLDVGASSGYYSQVLEIAGIWYYYTGLDFSEHYRHAASKLFDAQVFVGDATDLSRFFDASLDIIISGGMLMHTLDYAKAIREIQRVAAKQIVWHRTPVCFNSPTRYFIKDAYGLPCLEIHFNHDEILDLFVTDEWKIADTATVGLVDEVNHEASMSYLMVRK